MSSAQRAQIILENSKAVIEHGGDDMLYDSRLDTIVLPETEQFKDPEQYFAEALHQLAHWTSAEDRLNRSLNMGTDATIREELRTNLASLFLSKELNLPFDLNDHVGYIDNWSQLLKEEPAELFNAASDAQKIVNYIMAFEQKIEEKKEIAEKNEMPEGIGQSGNNADKGQEFPKINLERLTKGEIIPHNGTEFKVLAELRNNVYNMQDLSDERKFKMSSNSGLFASLVEARINSQEISTGIVAEHEVHEAEEASMEQDNEVDNARQMQR